MADRRTLTREEQEQLLEALEKRFEKNMHRHEDVAWSDVEERLNRNSDRLWSLNEMERTGGEPDVGGFENGQYIFYDFSKETPKGRRKVCYDHDALKARKKYRPEDSAMNMADSMGVELLTEAAYHTLQAIETLDQKTSSWIRTPDDVRSLGGALFGDHRYGRVFIYHNGADSYYGARGFRAMLRI